MLISVEGVYRNGKVEVLEKIKDVEDGSRAIVTFLPKSTSVDLRELGIDEVTVAELRGRLAAFEDDWNRPDMEIYDAVYAR